MRLSHRLDNDSISSQYQSVREPENICNILILNKIMEIFLKINCPKFLKRE
jgi:hypothetical protein